MARGAPASARRSDRREAPMRRLPPGTARRRLPPLAHVLLGVALAGVLCGGSCTVWYSSDDDDPGPCWDDDPENDVDCPDFEEAGAGAPDVDPAALSLRAWTLEPASEPGRHPVGRLRSDDGLSLPALWGTGPWGEDALLRFARDVIAANPEFLALPPAAGRLRPGAVRALDAVVVVEYEQLGPGAADDALALRDASIWFTFDARLHLVEVRNRTLVPAWSPLPPPRSASVSGAPPASGSARTRAR
jgi:hypothetical protein